MIKKVLLLFLVSLSGVISAQDSTYVNLKNPHATLYTHLYYLQSDSYEPEKSAKSILPKATKDPIKTAVRLKKILDGKGLFIDFNTVPRNPNYTDTTQVAKPHKYVPFPLRMPTIYVEKVDSKWYYSLETIQNVDRLYEEVYPWYIEKLQNILPQFDNKKIFGIEYWQLMGLILLFALSYLVFFVIKKIAFFVLLKIQYSIIHVKNIGINKVLKKLAHPISLLMALLLIDKVFPSLQFSLAINKWFFLAINIAETIFWIYIFLKLVDVIMKIYSEFTERTHNKLDDQLVPILRNLLTGLVLFLGGLKLLTLFGVNPTTVIAGVSIGGLALALASQDTVRNLIGTIMIFLDKPFHIGDWIETGEVVGTVEEVGFRSTRVRAADTSIYQIPNSKLAEIVINNKGLRLYRRYNTSLGIRYDTPPVLIEAFVKGVRELVIAHPETRSESYNVEFTGFGDSALLIMVNVYFKSLEWGTEQSSKHRLHMAIVKLAKALGVEFAFPSTTVQIEQFPEKKSIDMKYNTVQEDIDAAVAKIIQEFHNRPAKVDDDRDGN